VNAPVRPNPVENQPGKTDQEINPLDEDVTINITKSGSCAGLRLEFVRAPSSPTAAEREPVRVSFGDATSTILRGNVPTERWEDGNRSLRLFDTGNNVYVGRTETLVVE
jgi:hypothetical protein